MSEASRRMESDFGLVVSGLGGGVLVCTSLLLHRAFRNVAGSGMVATRIFNTGDTAVHRVDPSTVIDVLFCAVHGITSLLPRRLGIHSAGSGHCAFHPPPPRYVLDFHHPLSGLDRRAGLHCGRSNSRCRVAAWIFSGLSKAPTYSRTRASHPG